MPRRRKQIPAPEPEPAIRKFTAGEVVDYHGRPVQVLEVLKGRAPLSGATIDVVRVRDPRRGLRAMFAWQLADGIGAKPEKALVPDRDEAPYA